MGRAGNWLSSLLDLIFPPVCVLCEKGLGNREQTEGLRWKGHGICPDCARHVPWLRPPFCPLCAKPIPSVSVESHPCGECLLEPPPFDSARALVVYQEEVFPIIHRMKYGRRPSLARFLGELLATAVDGEMRGLGLDGIVPIPLHRERLQERGFNQASLMAGAIGRGLGIPVTHEAVDRIRWTHPQVGLTRAQRILNVQGAFLIRDPARIAGRRWLLLDDVYTTGSTLREVARRMKRAGAAEVHALTFARVL